MSSPHKAITPFSRRAGVWVLAWAVYTLCALAWFGYQDALIGAMCLAPR